MDSEKSVEDKIYDYFVMMYESVRSARDKVEEEWAAFQAYGAYSIYDSMKSGSNFSEEQSRFIENVKSECERCVISGIVSHNMKRTHDRIAKLVESEEYRKPGKGGSRRMVLQGSKLEPYYPMMRLTNDPGDRSSS